MAIALVGEDQVLNASASTAIVVPVPAGTAAGHEMVAVIAAIVQATITPPSGWTLLATQDAGSNVRLWIYRRPAGSSEPSSYTWTIGTSTKNWGWIGTYSGTDGSAPTVATGSTSSGTSHATPAVTVAQDGWLISLAATRHAATGSATTWTTSDGSDAERMDASSNAGTGQDISGAVYDSNRALSAGSASRTLTSSQTESQIAVASIALTPAVVSTALAWTLGIPLRG